jgi:dTDP-4-amino-4,6-dideoxygalactose transaminase
MNIDLINLGRLHDSIKDELFQASSETLKNADFVGSNAILEFENELAKIHSRKFAITCGSGTDALTLSLIASGVTKGDEVILPANTFVATAQAIIHAAGKPVSVHVNDENLLI